MYIHERDNWTSFRWNDSKVSLLQEKVFRKQGLLYGRLCSLGFDSKLRAMAENLTYDVVYSSEIGKYRTNEEHIVSGMFGREKIHYIAPPPDRVEEEMHKFLAWFDGEEPVSSVIRSAVAHFWFVSIHHFEDVNGNYGVVGVVYAEIG